LILSFYECLAPSDLTDARVDRSFQAPPAAIFEDG